MDQTSCCEADQSNPPKMRHRTLSPLTSSDVCAVADHRSHTRRLRAPNATLLKYPVFTTHTSPSPLPPAAAAPPG